jgi:hypothetical protein
MDASGINTAVAEKEESQDLEESTGSRSFFAIRNATRGIYRPSKHWDGSVWSFGNARSAMVILQAE